MKRFFLLPMCLLGVLSLFAAGCSLGDDDDTSGIVTLTGRVLNQATNNPVPNAFVRVLPYDLLFETDAEGAFTFEVEIDSTMELQVIATKDGFLDGSVEVLALAGRTVEVKGLELLQIVEDAPTSGLASNILLLSQTTQSIGVRESGSEEVASVTFQVADSLGRPVVLDHSAEIRFSLGVQPGGGEFIFPTSAQTDNNGKVTVNLSSGTRAGVVQLVAETTAGGRTIRSLPVSVAIHGGLPDQTHFSVGPERFNFPGLLTFGLADPISVIVGDRYSNPVKPGTAVYFSSTHGVVEGSVLTDEQGRGTVNLLSANPLPSNGVTVVTATTADENQQVVVGQTPVLMSGVPVVTVAPGTAILNQTYTLLVEDHNGNPLAPGTAVSVRAEGTKVKSVGNTSFTLDDTAFIDGGRDLNGDGFSDNVTDGDYLDFEDVRTGWGITRFTFRAVEDRTLDEEGTPELESITISVRGPNGSLEIVMTPGAMPTMRTEGARVSMRADGAAVIRLEQP